MVRYEISLRRSVLRKDLARIPKADARQITEAIHALAENPRPPGVQKLSGQERYRIKQGDYRVIYSVQDADHTVWVVKVGHRRDVYR